MPTNTELESVYKAASEYYEFLSVNTGEPEVEFNIDIVIKPGPDQVALANRMAELLTNLKEALGK